MPAAACVPIPPGNSLRSLVSYAPAAHRSTRIRRDTCRDNPSRVASTCTMQGSPTRQSRRRQSSRKPIDARSSRSVSDRSALRMTAHSCGPRSASGKATLRLCFSGESAVMVGVVTMFPLRLILNWIEQDRIAMSGQIGNISARLTPQRSHRGPSQC